jgi:general stress protein 26
VTLLAALLAAAAAPAAEFAPEFMQSLLDDKEIHVATVRKDGTRSSAVPVWFVVIDGVLWSSTSPKSIKARRVKRGSPMLVSVSGEDGPFVETNAELVTDAAVAERMGQMYADKYWIAWVGFYRPSAERVESGEIVLLKLLPAD